MKLDSTTLAMVALLVSSAACTTPATEVVVQLDSNAPADRALTIRATVRADSAEAGIGTPQTWTRGGPFGDVVFPATFGVISASGQARDAAIVLVVDAVLDGAMPGDAPIVFRTVTRFAFTPSMTTFLPVFLDASCGAPALGCTSVAAASCTASIRCDEQGLTCGPVLVRARVLTT